MSFFVAYRFFSLSQTGAKMGKLTLFTLLLLTDTAQAEIYRIYGSDGQLHYQSTLVDPPINGIYGRTYESEHSGIDTYNEINRRLRAMPHYDKYGRFHDYDDNGYDEENNRYR